MPKETIEDRLVYLGVLLQDRDRLVQDQDQLIQRQRGLSEAIRIAFTELVESHGMMPSIMQAHAELVARGMAPAEDLPVSHPAADDRPYYDKNAGELRLGKTKILTFTRPAKNQRAILLSFQRLNWDPAVLDPLGEGSTLKKLNDAVLELNKRCAPHIRFFLRGDMNVRWKLTATAKNSR